MSQSDDVIVVLDYANGAVHKFPYEGYADDAYETWLAAQGLRDADCYWMSTANNLVNL